MEATGRRRSSSSSSGSAMAAWGLCVCIAVLFLARHASGAASCTSDLTNEVTLFPTANLECQAYPLGGTNTFVLWSLKDNATQVVSIVVAAPLDGAARWAGLGFSGQGMMPGSTAMVATLNAQGAPQVAQYSLKDRVQSAVVQDNTGLSLLAHPQVSYDQATKTVYMAFQVDFTKSTAKPNFVLFAYGPASADGSTINIHDNKDVQPAQFTTGSSGPSAAESIQKLSRAHGAVQIFGWGILLPIGAMVARYARGFDPAWFYVHATLQISGFAFVVAGVGTGVNLSHKVKPEGFPAHRGLGLFIFILAILQILAIVLRPKKDAKVRKYWNWYHGWVGRFALFLAVINIFVGIHIAQAERKIKVGYAAILALELAAFAILETLLWRRWNRQPNPRSSTNDGFQFGGSV